MIKMPTNIASILPRSGDGDEEETGSSGIDSGGGD
jgi:hypothetical protein